MKTESNRASADTKMKAVYANYFKIGHNAFEFFFDFGQSQGELDEACIHTRIVSAPGHAKAFMEALRESISQYEREFGAIRQD